MQCVFEDYLNSVKKVESLKAFNLDLIGVTFLDYSDGLIGKFATFFQGKHLRILHLWLGYS